MPRLAKVNRTARNPIGPVNRNNPQLTHPISAGGVTAGKRRFRFGTAGAVEKAMRANRTLEEVMRKKGTPTTIINRRERELQKLGVKIGKREARARLLDARRAGAEANRDATHAWVWPLNVIIGAPVRGFWNWRVKRISRATAATENVIQALEGKAKAVEDFYDAQLGLKELRRTTAIEKRQATMQVALERVQKKMPAVRSRFTKAFGEVPVVYRSRLGKGYERKLRTIVSAIPTKVTGAAQAVELETYLRLMNDAFADGDYKRAQTFIDMAHAFATR